MNNDTVSKNKLPLIPEEYPSLKFRPAVVGKVTKTDRKLMRQAQEFNRKLDKYGHPDLFPEERQYNILHLAIMILFCINLLLISRPLIHLINKYVPQTITVEEIGGKYNGYNSDKR